MQHLISLSLLASATALAPFSIAQTRIQILHASDLEGGVQAVQDAPNFAAVVEALEDDAAAGGIPSLLLSAGDNFIPGPFFSAAGDFSLRSVFRAALGNPDAREGEGRVDISILNFLGCDAAAVGNHEFDAGTSAFASIIGTDIRGGTQPRWLGAQFPYLSANLDFSGDGSLSGLSTNSLLANTAFRSELADLTAAAAAPKLAPATIVERGGERFGIVGATTPIVESITSTGGVATRNPGAGTNDMAALASIIQPVIDDLTAMGIDKIVLVTHLQQFALEQALTPLLRGVDIVIAGGSDFLLADAGDRLRAGDVAQGPYPFATTNADGEPALLVSTDGQYSYVGRLVVDFDANGVVVPGSVVEQESGAFITDEQGVTDLWGGLAAAFASGTKGEAVQTLTSAVSNIVIMRDANVVGQSDVFIEGRRTPVRTQETNMGNLTADANLAAARAFDPTVLVSHKNGGGIRNPIGSIGPNGELGPNEANPLSGKQAGEISQLDIENSLRFNNGLTLITLTRTQFKEVLEHAVAGSGTPGQFGQFGGVSFSFDATGPVGDRVRYAALTSPLAAESVVVNDGAVRGAAPIRIVTLNFLADGGDSYPFPAFEAANPGFANRIDLAGLPALPPGAATFADAGTEQDAFAEFLLANFPVGVPFGGEDVAVEEDQRIQQIGTRPTLSVSGAGTPGSLLTFSVQDAEPLSLALLELGFRAGFERFDFGALGAFTIGIDSAAAVPLAFTGLTGAAAGFIRVPPVTATVDYVAQAVLLRLDANGLTTASTESVAFTFRP